MIKRIRKRFTKWYVKRGYTSGYLFIYDEHGEHPTLPVGAKRYFKCPWWVRPLLIFFSPCVYNYETSGYLSYDAFLEEMKSSIVEEVKRVREAREIRAEEVK